MNRHEIIEKIIEEQQKVIESLTQTANSFETASDIDEDGTTDPDMMSQQVQNKDMQLRYESLLKESKNTLSSLMLALDEDHENIDIGSVIETDENILFVGISVPKFIYNKKEVLSFSEQAPIFSQIKDKKVGDTITIGEKQHTILNIL